MTAADILLHPAFLVVLFLTVAALAGVVLVRAE